MNNRSNQLGDEYRTP